MPGLNGLEVAARVTREFPHVGVIIVSMHLNEEYALQALRSGARGYLVKGADTAELEIAIKAVASGQTYLSPGVSKHIVADYMQRVDAESTSLSLLTPRQREILQLIAEGHSTKKIAHDYLGHRAGDQLLIAVARRLEKCLRSSDTVGRILEKGVPRSQSNRARWERGWDKKLFILPGGHRI